MSKEINALPQYDRAKIKTGVGFFSTLIRMIETGRECIIPAIVESYDRKSGVATVRPLAKFVYDTKDGEDSADRQSYEVPVWRFIQGGFIIDAPLYIGSTGYLFAADRNCKDAISDNSSVLVSDQTSDTIQNKGSEKPTDNSLASFAWGFFLPFSWATTDVDEDDSLHITKTDSSGVVVDIEIASGTISIGANGAISVKGNSVSVENQSATKKLLLDNDTISATDTSTNSEVSISGDKLLLQYGSTSKVEIDSESIVSTVDECVSNISKDSVSITNGTDTIQIDSTGLVHSGPVDMLKSVVTDVKYDPELHQLQKKVMPISIRGDFIVGHEDETDWIKADGGQAVPENI